MKSTEFYHIILAILVFTVVIGFVPAIKGDFNTFAQSFFFATIIILVAVFSKKIMAQMLDASVEHTTWTFSRYGIKPGQHLKKPIPAGIIFPLFLTLFSLGTWKFPAILTYETKASKYRAAKRHGYYSYTEMTDFHNGLIGAAGLFSVLILAFVVYFLPTDLEYLSQMAIIYTVVNLIPISNLDGTQIFFGSRVLWTTLATITAFFAFAAILI